MNKILIVICFLFYQPLYGDNLFAEHFEYSASFVPQHADEITQFFIENERISSKNRIFKFKQFNDAISLQIQQNPKSAVLWFAKGLNFKNRLQALEEQKKLGAKNINPAIKQTKNYLQQSFNKAIQLDDVKKPKLTPRMYATMKHNLTDNMRIEALQKELSLGGSGDNETHYWFTHWDVIGSLQDEGRFEEAEVALYQFKKELKASGLENSQFKQIYQQAKTQLAEDHVLSQALEKNLNLKNDPVSANQSTRAKPLFESIKNTFSEYWFMVLLNIFIISSLIYAFIKREKD